jgi:hypothetical protein
VNLGYADDIAIYSNQDSLLGQHSDLQIALNWCSRWARKWRVVFSLVKSKFMLFTRRRKPPALPPLLLSAQAIQYVGEFCYLGYTLDSSFSGDSHYKSVLAKAKVAAFNIKQTIGFGGFRSPKLLAIVVKTLLLPVISYAFPFWKPNTAQESELNSVILSVLKFGCGISRGVASEAIFHELDILPVQLLFSKFLLSFYLRLENGLGGDLVSSYYRHL